MKSARRCALLAGGIKWQNSTLAPALGFLGRENVFLRHVEAHFVVNDFEQRDVRQSEIGRFTDERTAHGTAASVGVPNPPGNKVYQDVGVSDFCEGLFCEFRVHANFERANVTGAKVNAIEKFPREMNDNIRSGNERF